MLSMLHILGGMAKLVVHLLGYAYFSIFFLEQNFEIKELPFFFS